MTGAIKSGNLLAQRIKESTSPFVVVGGGGWLGRSLLDMLLSALGQSRFLAEVQVLGSSTRQLEVAPGVYARCLALSDWRSIDAKGALIFYNSFLTRDKVADIPLDRYIEANRAISVHVADMVRTWNPRALLLPSSGAVYAQDGNLERDLTANPYGALKVEDEERFSALCDTSCSVVIPRIFGLSGEYINKTETYALADFILQLKTKRTIFIRSTRPVYRSYIYVGDLLSISIFSMLDNQPGRMIFDTAGEEVIEVGDLADRIRRLLGFPEAVIHRNWNSEAEEDRYLGNGAILTRSASHYGVELMSLDEQILRTATFLEGFGEEPSR